MEYRNFQGGWTDERMAQLRHLATEGLSMSQIAVKLGGVSRSAVIGKMSRLGLSPGRRQASPRARELKEEKRRARRARQMAVEAPEFATRGSGKRETDSRKKKEIRLAAAEELRSKFACVEVVDLPPDESAVAVSLLKLTKHTCRWPLGDPRDLEAMKFCGAPPYEGKRDYPYCARHCRVAYQSVRSA